MKLLIFLQMWYIFGFGLKIASGKSKYKARSLLKKNKLMMVANGRNVRIEIRLHRWRKKWLWQCAFGFLISIQISSQNQQTVIPKFQFFFRYFRNQSKYLKFLISILLSTQIRNFAPILLTSYFRYFTRSQWWALELTHAVYIKGKVLTEWLTHQRPA